MPEILLFMINDAPHFVGLRQISFLDAIFHNSSREAFFKAADRNLLKKLRDRVLIEQDEDDITLLGENIVEKHRKQDFETYPHWGAAMNWKKAWNKENKKNRKLSPCGCVCYKCVRHCSRDKSLPREILLLLSDYHNAEIDLDSISWDKTQGEEALPNLELGL